MSMDLVTNLQHWTFTRTVPTYCLVLFRDLWRRAIWKKDFRVLKTYEKSMILEPVPPWMSIDLVTESFKK